MKILTSLKRSSLSLDLYLWLVLPDLHASCSAAALLGELYRQFGVDPAKANNNRTVQDFRKDCLRELKKIKLAWAELNYTTAPGVLILLPSVPTVAPSYAPPRLVE